ncbi:LysM peptidoglycan-binding domain-containing protein [Gracilibacillus sp. S3-1-1]|uniref:LysM peptidoglycan-binding domain-containing protein n=1 Tax=Gracilibacillus pellucidus TaxID=3095368 RepID=A0ACC6M3Y2_9BACI|nr:LysM peptidoglycan-binding domain-containing protein [Gracilibacillus sp. S3-1-1]MDX8045593.1 LysM peptidoglycan-binding domain-containing protein [Gracilibacillus sp. S3-1-1]
MAIHVVQSGETLAQIAKQYTISVAVIVAVNGLPSANDIVPGLALYIPDTDIIQYRSYIVKEGDTLWQLANHFDTTITAITKANPTINPHSLSIGQKLLIPTATMRQMETLGFLIPGNLSVLRSLSNFLTYVAIVAYSFTEEGYVSMLLDDTAAIEESKRVGITPLLMIRNFTGDDFDAELAGNVLRNAEYRANLINSLLQVIDEKGYGGVSLDMEFIPPTERENFNLFLYELKRALGSHILHVNVHAKTEDLPTNRIVGAYDYQMIGQIADIVAVMTMDYGYPGGPPAPVAPITWVEEVVQYTTSLIHPQKVQIAFPLYGYDWDIAAESTTALSVNRAQNQAISAKTVIEYDQTAATPWYSYTQNGEEHIVWFEDIRSYRAKYVLVDQYQLLGVTYWHINLPAPQNWVYLYNHFVVEKREVK